jgi:GcrA cell cycle regulator
MSWTDERIALLKKMWKEGKSAADIAKTLGKGVTRNAVIGKAHRMGLSGRPSPIKKPAPAKKEAAAAPKTAAAKPAKKPAAPPARPVQLAPAREADEFKKVEPNKAGAEKIITDLGPLDGGVALIDLTERMCKWPFGDPREDGFTFCGRPRRPGAPYCQDHAAMAYQASSRNRGRGPIVAVVPEKVAAEEPVEAAAEEDDEVA